MTQETYTESLGKILLNKEKIEEKIKIKITNKGKILFIEGSPENEYLALRIIEAMNLGFSIDTALLLEDEENLLQILNIKDITKRNDIERVRARIIGTHGKTIKNLKFLTDCSIALHENKLGIIGHADDIKEAIISLTSLVKGSKQANVYARLEKKKKEKRLNPKVIRKQDLILDKD
jgi:KH domain-containing protein